MSITTCEILARFKHAFADRPLNGYLLRKGSADLKPFSQVDGR